MPIPWQARFAAKAVLARLPIARATWQRFGIFDHGPMADPAYATQVFQRHFEEFRHRCGESEFVAAELGPGNSLSSALLAAAQGAARTYLIDVEPAASPDMRIYRSLARYLGSNDRVGQAVEAADAHRMLDRLNAHYLTEGIRSLRSIPDASVDFLWSHTVLQYIWHTEFDAYLKELRRIVKPGGVCSHEIDFRDMIGASLNHLRFSDARWHTKFVLGSDVYTNRLRYSEMWAAFERAGFAVETRGIEHFPDLPIARAGLDARFRGLSDEDLRVAVAHVVLV